MRTTIIKVIILIIISFHNQTLSKKLDLQVLKDACTSIGFKTKTEKHGECVLELHKRSDELKLFKVSESNNYNESFQKANKPLVFSTYFEAKNECSRLGLSVLSNYKDWICEDKSQTSEEKSFGVHCSELYGCYPEKDDHELMVESLIDEQKQKLEERESAIAFRFKNELSACLSLVTTPSGRKKCENAYYKKIYPYPYNQKQIVENQYSPPLNNKANKQNSSDIGSLVGNLLKLGIIIGGIYLLGNSFTSTSQSTQTLNSISKFNNTNPIHPFYGPYKTPFGY